MKNTVLFSKKQILSLKESLEDEKKKLSTNLRPFIFNQVKRHMTSLGDNEAFPPEENLPFDYMILKDRFQEVSDALVNISDLESFDDVYLSNRLSRLVKKCKEIEEPIRPHLEKICTNVILQLFDIPSDTVDFEGVLVDKIEPEKNFRIKPEVSSKRKFDFDSIDDFDEANKAILKRRLINALIQGASYTYSVDRDLFLSEIYKIDKRLIDLYNEITILNDYLLFVKEEKITDKTPMQGGCVEVMLSSKKDKTKIKAQGLIFPFLLHELIKGFLELFASHGLPEDNVKARYIINQADFLIAEPWDLRMGVGLWRFFSNELVNTSILPYFFMNLCSLPTNEFNTTLKEIFAHTKKGQHLLKHLIANAENDLETQGFVATIDKKNAEIALIADSVYSAKEIDGMIDEALQISADKSIFEYPNGKLYNAFSFAEVNNLLEPIFGEYSSFGSSRIVYDIDDYQVLKVSYGGDDEAEAGEKQNTLERSILTDRKHKKYSIFPKFYYGCPSDRWIVVEKVLPAVNEDFIKIFNLPFDNDVNTTFIDFVSWAYDKGKSREFRPWERKYVELANSSKELLDFFYLTSSHRLILGDLIRLDNYGITVRNGEPKIVLLDAGLNKKIYQEFYEARESAPLMENATDEASYTLDSKEKGKHKYDYQTDEDWAKIDSDERKLLRILALKKGITDPQKIDKDVKKNMSKQNKIVDASKRHWNSFESEFEKELINRILKQNDGRNIYNKDDLKRHIDFDTESLSTKNGSDKNKLNLETNFDATKLGQIMSHGNAKLSADILIVNLTSAKNCPSAKRKHCKIYNQYQAAIKNGKTAPVQCYAQRDEHQYPNTIQNNVRAEIIMPLMNDDEFISYIEEYIEKCDFVTNYIRFNESGDFPSQEFVSRCEKAAEYFYKNHGIISSAYTCRLDLDFSNCHYLIINASHPKIKGADRFYLAVSDDKFNSFKDVMHGVGYDENGEPYFKCHCNCKICKFCYQTRNQNNEDKNKRTRVLCAFH